MQDGQTMRDERIRIEAHFMVATNATVRRTAEVFGMSKTTVHLDVSQRLEKIDPQLFLQARKVLDTNKAERHIRGGRATQKRYLRKKNS